MSINLRFPNITGHSEKEQITQIKSYLHQLVEQLNYALPTLGTGDGATQSEGTKSTQTYEVQGGDLSYYELRSLIIQGLQEVQTLFDQLSQKVEADVDVTVETSLREAKDSGEFDGVSCTHKWNGTVLSVTSASGTSSADLKGEKGDKGDKGDTGSPGDPGIPGTNGEDYVLTEADKNEIAAQAAQKISFTLDEDGNLYYEVEE